MNMAYPVVLRASQRSRRRRRDTFQHILSPKAQQLQIVEHPFIVTGFLGDMVAEIGEHSLCNWILAQQFLRFLGGGLHERNATADYGVIAEQELRIDFAQTRMTP